MRTLVIAGLGAALVMPAVSDAQRIVQRGPGASYGVPARMPAARPMQHHVPDVRPMPHHVQNVRPMPHHVQNVRPMPHGGNSVITRPGHGGNRWEMRGGRWLGGWNAPGGWNAYRRPFVGYALPGYWVQPGFAISSWSTYGLAQPPQGYSWYRYYDDAVLVDGRGSVRDHVDGIAWDGYEDGDAYAGDVPVAPDRYAREDGYREDYHERRDSGPDYRRDNGLGGAAIGAVAGGVAGNVIAGRGNRLGGTLIGAGVGAAAGYAIDKAEDRDRRAPPPAYGARYPAPAYGQSYHPGYPQPRGAWPGGWVSPDGRTVVTTAGGYGGTTTTVVVQSAPVVTTTTVTEYYDDHVTWSKPVARKTYKRKWKPSKTICRC